MSLPLHQTRTSPSDERRSLGASRRLCLGVGCGIAAIAVLTLDGCQLDDLLSNPPPPPGSVIALNRLTYIRQPGNITAGTPFAQPIVVAVQDENGNTVTSFTGSVTLTIGTNPGGGTLLGTTTRTAAAGVATFAGLSVDKPGAGYQLSATAPGSDPATSATFNVSAGAPASITIAGGDAQSDTVGATLTPYTVRVRDASSNPAAGLTIRWVAAGGAISVATSQSDAQGIAGAVHTLGTTPGAQTVTASVSGVANLTVTFTATALPGAVAALTYLEHPSDVKVLRVIEPPVRVAAVDQHGNRATNFTGAMQVGIAPGTGSPVAVLSGTLSVNATAGVASFDDLRLSVPAEGYRLRVRAGNVSVASKTFDVYR